MVLKNRIAGINSGNTIRCHKTAFKQRYNAQSAIVKSLIGDANADSVEDCLATDVQYSLNKKGRWQLLQYLRKEAVAQAWKELPTPIALAERHKLKRQNNCYAFYSSTTVKKRPSKKLLRKKLVTTNTVNKYFSLPSTFLNPEKANESVVLNDEEMEVLDMQKQETLIQPEVLYEVYAPCPPSSSLAHNPKYLEPVAASVNEEHFVNRVNRRKSRGHRRHAHLQRELPDLVSEWEVENDEEMDLTDTNTAMHSKSLILNMNELIEEAMLQRALKLSAAEYHSEQKACANLEASFEHVARVQENEEDLIEKKKGIKGDAHNTKKYGKGQALFIPFPAKPKENLVPTQITKRTIPPMEAVSIKVPRADFCSEKLLALYGEDYREAKCAPRCVCLSLTRMLRTVQKTSTKKHGQNLEVYLLLQEEREKQIEGEDLDLEEVKLSVYVNIYATTEVKLPCFDVSAIGVEQLVHTVIKHLASLPSERLMENSEELVATCKSNKFSLTRKLNGTANIDKNLYVRNQFETNPNSEIQKTLSSPATVEECAICFCVDGWLALRQCGHWFCRDCWVQHLVTKAYSADLCFTCPAFACKSLVDEATILLLLPLKVYNLVRQRALHSSVAKCVKQCPVQNCERLLVSKNQDLVFDVACDCGADLCFSCLEQAHWPAFCSDAKEYRNLLIKKGKLIEDKKPTTEKNSGPLRFSIYVKPCPRCGRLVEKNGGCPEVRCYCSYYFCWGCGKPLNAEHKETGHCHLSYDRHGTERLWVVHKPLKPVKQANTSVTESRHHTQALFCLQQRSLLQKKQVQRNLELYLLERDKTSALSPLAPSARKELQAFCRHVALFCEQLHRRLEYYFVRLDSDSSESKSYRAYWQELEFHASSMHSDIVTAPTLRGDELKKSIEQRIQRATQLLRLLRTDN